MQTVPLYHLLIFLKYIKLIFYLCVIINKKSNTMSVSRFGVSLENELLEALDGYVHENQFPNRSQAIRHLIEKNLVEKKWKCNNIVCFFSFGIICTKL